MKQSGKILFANRLFLAGIAALLICWGCDKVSQPYKQKSTAVSDSTCSFTSTEAQPRVMLLEEYTGHRCGNCPPAGDAAVALKAQYGEALAVMTVHAGSFTHTTAPGTLFSYDFTCPAGIALNTKFGITSNPSGMVNRMDYPTNHVKSYSTWGTEIANKINTPADANIFIHNTYNTTTRELTVCTKTKWLNTLTGSYRLVIYMIEDSIDKPQINYSLPVDTMVHYWHRHVLRTVVNNEEGEPIPYSIADSTFQKSYSITLNTDWNDKHCSVIPVVYNVSTNEIVQAGEKKVY